MRAEALRIEGHQAIEQLDSLGVLNGVHGHLSKLEMKKLDEGGAMLTEKQSPVPSLNYGGQESWCSLAKARIDMDDFILH